MLPILMPRFVVIELELWLFEAAITGNRQTDRLTQNYTSIYRNPTHARESITHQCYTVNASFFGAIAV